ncbi:MAG: CpsB/CapC family capsule biosynthesis tyrosine phosphatase [Armatimonadota bacterium]|nr:phosphotransferase [bacterium]MDW8320960.1 CpsB/CapC family capsule biosynthesis tyrosine phosphatase [Armatimonadota bacterium]
MIDIHTHILPGVDDGLQDIGEALLMAEDAASQGVRAMVATPHLYWHGRQALSAAQIRHGVGDLNTLIQAKGVPVEILPGCEIPLQAELLERLQRDEWMSLGDSGRAVLVEPPWGEWLPYGKAVLQNLLEAGWMVVLAHPERHVFFQRNLSLLEELVQMGVHLQVSTGSLIAGRSEPAAARCAYELMERRLVSVVASDCHGIKRRRCDLGEAAELLKRSYGQHVAQMLTTNVPRALLRGERVDLQQVWRNVPTDNSRWKKILRAVLRRQTDDG